MTRREILEKNWKDFRLSTGLEYEPMSDKAYEFMENAMEQYAELRLGAVSNSVCDCCVPSPEDPFEYENPICSKCGGAMKQTVC